MVFPDFSYEEKLWETSYQFVAGVDEVGRGCLAGPVAAATIVFDSNHVMIDGVNDSKKLSDKRRGKDTVHTRWGPNITVLLGDYIYINTIGSSLNAANLEITKTLIQASAQMLEGELNEYYHSGKLEITEEDYLDILNKKTASLFSACCQIGGRLAGAPEKSIPMQGEFGINFGMCFPLIDDLLDYSGDPESLGKPVLSDLREGRITLPLIYTFNNDGQENRKSIRQCLHLLDDISDIRIGSRTFHRVQLHRNNRHYRLLLHVCRLLHELFLPGQQSGIQPCP